ncbi:MAG: BglG family transcription antiterminator LicT [Oliverpabstia sp.]
MRIKKVINNNILCAIDEKGNELIVTGKGIGFKRFTGELIDQARIEKIYRMEGKEEQKKLRELVEQIPLEHLRLTQELIEYIKSQISHVLNESLLITLADHISFAIQRKEKGIEFSNPLSGPVMCYYPAEYQVGRYCLKKIEERCRIQLNPDEATFIALHIVNAEMNTNMSQMYDITKILDGCIQIAGEYYQKKWNEESVDFSRFVVHLRYLIWRTFQGKGMENKEKEEDILFREIIQQNYKEHYYCAEQIVAYIEEMCHKKITEEEKVYMTIHLKCLNRYRES